MRAKVLPINRENSSKGIAMDVEENKDKIETTQSKILKDTKQIMIKQNDNNGSEQKRKESGWNKVEEIKESSKET